MSLVWIAKLCRDVVPFLVADGRWTYAGIAIGRASHAY